MSSRRQFETESREWPSIYLGSLQKGKSQKKSWVLVHFLLASVSATLKPSEGIPGELVRCQDFSAVSHCYAAAKQQFANHKEQRRLFECGTPLWHSLVEWLSPNLIIASLARSHLSRISFAQRDGWRVVYTVRRNNPYVVELAKLRMRNGGTIGLVFGKAANTPFGTVSNVEKERIGSVLKSHIHG